MEAIGPLLLVFSLPFMLRLVPPNRFFGFRIPATLRDRSVWYDANALISRHLFVLGVVLVSLEFVLPLRLRIGMLRAIASVGCVAILIADWRTANRWERARRNPAPRATGLARQLQP